MASSHPTILAPIQLNDPNSGVALEMARRLPLGTHGRGGLSHFFMGSVAEKVLREAPCAR